MLEYLFALFDWCKVQLLLRDKTEPILFKEGEIWWCSVGLNVGVEALGKGAKFTRPVLVFKKLSTHSFLGVPITSQEKKGSWYIVIRYDERNDSANLGQIRVLDARRLTKRVGTLGTGNFEEVQAAFVKLYAPKNSHPAPSERRESVGNPKNISS